MAYLIGYRLGSQMIPQMLPGITADDIDLTNIAKGIAEGLSGQMDESIVNEDVQSHQEKFLAILQERSDASNKGNIEAGQIYLAENAKKQGVITTASGLQYEVIVAGDGESYSPEAHGDAPTAKVMYKGSLIDGTIFDQSQSPVEFNITQVIPGFTEALKSMPIGAKWIVTIPADKAYGANGPGQIGPNSTLIFEMELLGLTK